MVEENINEELRMKNIYETRNDFLKEIEQNELIEQSTKRFVQL